MLAPVNHRLNHGFFFIQGLLIGGACRMMSQRCIGEARNALSRGRLHGAAGSRTVWFGYRHNGHRSHADQVALDWPKEREGPKEYSCSPPFNPSITHRWTMVSSSTGSANETHCGVTILVVDDNRDLVTSTAKLLEMAGYTAIAAYSAREAVDLLDEVERIDLVLSDIRMPGVDGFDLLRVLRHRFPSLPIILMSGLAVTSDDIVPSGATILMKPFDATRLEQSIKRKLASRPLSP
jgi:CheY-like chemotaxis protein